MSADKENKLIDIFSNNDIIKQTIPKDIICEFIKYLPEFLSNKNIYKVVNEYLSNNKIIKEKIIKKYGNIKEWDVHNVTIMSKLFKEYEILMKIYLIGMYQM